MIQTELFMYDIDEHPPVSDFASPIFYVSTYDGKPGTQIGQYDGSGRDWKAYSSFSIVGHYFSSVDECEEFILSAYVTWLTR